LTRVGADSLNELTVALGRTAFDRSKLGAIDETRPVNPWEVEKQPNPVYYPYSSRGEASKRGASNDSMVGAALKEHADLSERCESTSDDGSGTSMQRPAPLDNQPYDTTSIGVPELCSLTGMSSDDTDMTEPETPVTAGSSTTSDSGSKQYASSLPFSIYRGLGFENDYDDGSDLITAEPNGKSPMPYGLRVLSVHHEMAISEDLKAAEALTPGEILSIPASLDTKDRTLSLEGNATETSESLTRLRPNATFVPESSTSRTSTFACTHCPLSFTTKGKLKYVSISSSWLSSPHSWCFLPIFPPTNVIK
jgi:hypothetical protein